MAQNEELLRPRYKVIASYPGSQFDIGDILFRYDFETSTTGMYAYVTNLESPLQGASLKKEYVENYPHIFKKLEWWEDRRPDEMPEYVRSIRQEYSFGITKDRIVKVKKWVQLCEVLYVIQSPNREYHPSCLVPVTKAEYEQYINQQQPNHE